MNKKSIDNLFEGKNSFNPSEFANLGTINKKDYQEAKRNLDSSFATEFRYGSEDGNLVYRSMKRLSNKLNRKSRYDHALEMLASNDSLKKYFDIARSVEELSAKHLSHYASAFNEYKRESNTTLKKSEDSEKEYKETLRAFKQELKSAKDSDDRGSEYEEERTNAKINYLKNERMEDIKNEFSEMDEINKGKALILKKFYEISMKNIKARSLARNAKISEKRYKNYVLKNKKFFG